MPRLTGIVRWYGTQTAIAGVDVQLIKGKTARAKATTDAQGGFTFERVTAGKGYALRATAAGAASLTTPPFTITAGENPQTIELTRSSITTTTTATTATTSTTSTDTRTIMGTTATVTTDSTTTDTTTTDTTSTDTSSTLSSTTTASTATTATTATTASTATTATTATVATIVPTASGGLPAGTTAFDDLDKLVSRPNFDRDAAVNIDEARQFRRLYTVTNYTLARVPGAVGALNSLLNTSTPPGAATTSTLPLMSKQALIDKHQSTMDSILARASDNTRTEGELLTAARSQFDLGTAAVPNVNIGFKTLFREFVGLCANDLLGVDPNNVSGKELSEQQKKEELFNVLKRTKRALLRLVENMSIAGTLGSASLIDKWSRLLTDSLGVLSDVGQFVGDDDNDRKHIWSVVAELNQVPKAAINSYIVHAREGGSLLGDAIDAYQQLSTKGQLTSEDQVHLRDFFFDSAKYSVSGETISARFRRNALFIQENWIAAWN